MRRRRFLLRLIRRFPDRSIDCKAEHGEAYLEESFKDSSGSSGMKETQNRLLLGLFLGCLFGSFFG